MVKTVNVGLIMPIAAIDNCSEGHWLEVKSIISESLISNDKYQFETKIVSESDSIGLIHKRIVQGIYNSDIVICDVSCKNPNVMFELGMRLAFDKPTVIIKDDKTTFSFDTSGIEHIEYPRDLRFTKIVEFKEILLKKVIATYEDSINDPNHSPFLKSFGQFKVAKLEETEVTPFDLIFDKLSELQSDISSLKKLNNIVKPRRYSPKMDVRNAINEAIDEYMKNLSPDSRLEPDNLTNFVIDYLKNRSTPAYSLPKQLLAEEIWNILDERRASLFS
ncbi:hypothetical protein PACILC2_21710 [Paenibacillus cisolokensis]|uniref:RNA helicase n=1 Tax=Paenibacillus cisolokensis TaxID=1658519 RepID=A0ABQ4N5X5_9BACL|nr:hypothetical protein [Paenibacillus cisolokensis]GIQ63603.1 hypothetical protein PACILC2_21710 [Paenibacillus cisolokensis]